MTRPLLVILTILLLLTYEVIFNNKFYPGVFIGDTNLTFLTKPQAQKLVLAKFDKRANLTVNFSAETQNFTIDLSKTSSVNFDESLNEAFSIGHSGSLFDKLRAQLQVILKPKVITPEVSLYTDSEVELIENAVNKKSQNADLSPEGEVQEEIMGRELDKLALQKALEEYLIFGKNPSNLPVKEIIPDITTSKALTAKAYLEEIKLDPIILVTNENKWVLDDKTILPLLLNKERLIKYLENLSLKVNQPLKEAQFNFNPGSGKVSAFQPAQEGRELDIEKTATLIQLALSGDRPKTITLPVKLVEPKIQTSEVNSLGIKELIGRGVSNFAGSIANRIYNVGLTASRLNGVLVPPDNIFSFNGTVGDITEATGFKKAYVIKEGRTVLDDGGGVCQDSTTLFRAVLNAGLPIIKRTAHAYRVGYYEQGFPPGLDATVFYPTVDFQFKNDTGHHILIQAHTEGLTLYVDLYGTSDGRVASLTKPVVTDITPAPPELRQDDPSLAKGVIKQVDFAAAGAKVSFNRIVIRNGETLISETWKSNYKPWQAIYLVGVGD